MSNTLSDGTDRDIRPVVRTVPASNLGLWAFVGLVLVGGLLLFQTLNARRLAVSAPATQAQTGPGVSISAPPPLALPQQDRIQTGFDYQQPLSEMVQTAPQLPNHQPTAVPFPARAVTRVANTPSYTPPATAYIPASQTTREQLVIPWAETLLPVAKLEEETQHPARSRDRVTATRLQNPSLTVPQGMIIPAVLETALDSTRAGAARAIVSRDVMSFDGSRVLIPRGSRLYGEYASDLGQGQRRALITWLRLTRPDAVIVSLDSPAADPLGRAGVGGKVNTHFFARFGSAILQSVLDIGVGVATRSAVKDGLIVALPGSTQQVTGQLSQQGQQVQPTLRVRQGTSVSVFVARDLDFSTVDR